MFLARVEGLLLLIHVITDAPKIEEKKLGQPYQIFQVINEFLKIF